MSYVIIRDAIVTEVNRLDGAPEGPDMVEISATAPDGQAVAIVLTLREARRMGRALQRIGYDR